MEKNHSSLWFSVPIAAGITKVHGSFSEFTASITWDEEDMSKSSVQVVIDPKSISTGNDMRDHDLLGVQFFDYENHREITFNSKEIKETEDGYIAIGDLTIRGHTKEIELPFVITEVRHLDDGRPIIGVSAQTTINRQDFEVGSNWKHDLIDNFIGDEITIQIDLWTKAPKKD